MINNEDFLKKAEAVEFAKTNGNVMRALNALGYQFKKLDVIQSILEGYGTARSNFVDSVNFLNVEEYIELRKIGTHEKADLSDTSYRDCEARYTGKGTRLMNAEIKDKMIEV